MTEKKELKEELKDNHDTIKTIELAKKLDQKLPESARGNNRHLNEIKEDFPSFFDEDSGSTSTKESLKQVKEYINSEQSSLKSELAKIDSKIKALTTDTTEDSQESSKNPLNHEESEPHGDSKPYVKKNPRSGDGNNGSGGSGPSQPDSSQSSSEPPSPSTPDQGGSFDTNNDLLLNFILMIIKAISGDDNFEG